MQRKSFKEMQCPVARGLEHVGEWWSILILRDAFSGMTRFDDFQKKLEIAPNMLTKRLSALVSAGLLERRQYCERPARYEYVLTERGHDFRPVLISLHAWGNRHFAPKHASIVLTDVETGLAADPVLIDRVTGQPITALSHKNVVTPLNKETPSRQSRAATSKRTVASKKPRRQKQTG